MFCCFSVLASLDNQQLTKSKTCFFVFRVKYRRILQLYAILSHIIACTEPRAMLLEDYKASVLVRDNMIV